MIVAVGSKNKAKLWAVKMAFGKYFKGARVKGVAVESTVGKQPVSLNEIVRGAKARAKGALETKARFNFGVGLEAGIFPFPESNSGFMDTACCAIFDGKKFFLGCSPMYEYPKRVVEMALAGKEVGKSFVELFGLSEEFVKGGESVSGFLTKGVLPRSKLLELAVVCALTQVINKELYK